MMIINYEQLTPELARKGCFVLNMPNDKYHAYEGISKSGLDKVNRSPAHYFLAAKREPTAAMKMGTIVHTAVLEPERFKEEYIQLEGINDKRKSEYKEAVKVHCADNVLTGKESAQLASLQESIRSNHQASDALLSCDMFEVSAFVEINGVIVRCRYDALNIKAGVSVDLKTTQCSEREEFAKSVYNYRYHVQDAIYSEIFRRITGRELMFIFLAVENEPPHCPMIYDLDKEAKQYGLQEAMANLEAYKQASTKQEWIGYEQTGEPLTLPNWALARYENELSEGIV